MILDTTSVGTETMSSLSCWQKPQSFVSIKGNEAPCPAILSLKKSSGRDLDSGMSAWACSLDLRIENFCPESMILSRYPTSLSCLASFGHLYDL